MEEEETIMTIIVEAIIRADETVGANQTFNKIVIMTEGSMSMIMVKDEVGITTKAVAEFQQVTEVVTAIALDTTMITGANEREGATITTLIGSIEISLAIQVLAMILTTDIRPIP